MTKTTTEVPYGPYSGFQVTALVTLRMLIGWHFCYEGLAKLLNPYWTSAGYLAGSQWFLKDLLIDVAANATAVTVVDFLNQWGLVAIGLGLMLGALTRTATIAGVVLLVLYWIVAPPFAGVTYAMPAEGSYVLVNKVLVELGALLVVWAFPTSHVFGLDRYLVWTRTAKPAAPEAAGEVV
jgi:thiosulfate dehydrogenase [quinone] large subunit